ncbi:MAG: universal stress protein [Candidatus Melainabacteria bacterium]|nr:universal stress protein [Candidatus Melainabacteria bacterium]
MSQPSFLLCLNGSIQSQRAAQLAFEMANKSNAQITAQHVVDTSTTWDFLRNDEPGFIGSGVYVETFELLKKAQWGIACKLLEKYEAVVETKNIVSTSVIDEGAPVEQICKRANEHDLVIVGHRHYLNNVNPKERWHYVHYTIAEGLANQCPKPLLVVQDIGPELWQDLKILVSLDHLNITFIRACLRTAFFFGLKPQIICLMNGYHEESAKELIKNLHQTHPDLAEVDITTRTVSSDIDFDFTQMSKSLIIVPTRKVQDKSYSILGTEASELVAKLPIGSILLWPEESIASHTSIENENRNFEKLTAQ